MATKSQNPWISIWRNPRATIAKIVATNPNRSLWLLAAIYGFSSLLNLFQSASLGQSMGVAAIFLVALILSPFWGYAAFAVWSWVVSWTGKLFKGKGTFQTVRTAYAWSCVPLVFNIPLWLLMAALFGHQLFLSEGVTTTDGMITFLFLILIAKIALAVWSIVIYLNGLAEVQKYSILRAVGNVIVAGIIVGVVVAILWGLAIHMLGISAVKSPTASIIGIDSIYLESLRRGL